MKAAWMWVCSKAGSTTPPTKKLPNRMRKRCKILVALGDCAVFGGVPAMRNFFTLEEALRRAYVETESNEHRRKNPQRS